ncbi:aspartate ammonia-lyase [Leifsonia shinshuensis]|uniref:Aspartate ammonia-lyase n=1 Tax=Leifsonia shinshuensis TaxID=150026 RepID=A0A853CWP7_9MICO|nr:aspartate ammonia-lyase [Leifsonia shinshuensis]
MTATRTEHDSLGPVEVPADAYWGANTQRAVENFPISGRGIGTYPELVTALALVKQAAARANAEIGVLEPSVASVIDEACQDIAEGALHDQFVVDLIQGGAGTSTNMNANEVIANRALERLGLPRGRYDVIHPLDHVNRSQSTNDVYPTAVKVALTIGLRRLIAEHALLAAAFRAKGVEFRDHVKIGRTQLQDAVPMTLGQEFTAFAVTMDEDNLRLTETIPLLGEINLGATAIGTGITASPGYAAAVVRHLAALTGLPLVTATDLIEATSDTGVFMLVSAALKRAAIKLSKISSDLRLLSSGPQFGFGELHLPPRQAGSSIMPGKVNPVIPEVVNQVAFAIAGADVSITMAADNGQLQLNAFEPVIANALLQGLTWLTNACRTLRVNCVDGIQADAELLRTRVASSVGLVTALTPRIGYTTAAQIAHEALETGGDVRAAIVGRGLLTAEEYDAITDPRALTGAR